MPITVKEAALLGLRHRRDQISSQIRELEAELSGSRDGQPAPRKKRRISAAGRRRIAEASRRRWAKFHAERQAAEVAGPMKKAAKRAGSKKVART
jgi:hypothetical protein